MSPDGTQVLATTFVQGTKRLTVLELGDKTTISQSFALPEKRDLVWYRWAGNRRILLSLGEATRLMGDDVYVTRLLMYDLEARKLSFVGKRDEGVDGDDVIFVDRDGRSLLLSVQKTIYDYPSVYRVDLDTMEMTRVVSEYPHENVPASQSKKLHEAMTKAKKPHSFVVYEGEGHGLENAAHAIDFLNRVDEFLRTHNPAG
jgi:Prolyl oligopeptidase family